MTDANITFDTENEAYHFSQNHSATRFMLDDQIRRLLKEPHSIHDEGKLLDAELAVFSGNLFQKILGGPQPRYYLGRLSDYKPDDEFSEFDHPYFSISQTIENYVDWADAVEVTENDIHVFGHALQRTYIQNLTAMLVAGHFLGEVDWSDCNFGLIKDKPLAVRVDPGLSFADVFFEAGDNLAEPLDNLLLNFIFRDDYNECYLDDFIDYEDEDQGRLKHPKAKKLFCNKLELLPTIKKITHMTEDDFKACAINSFHPSHSHIASELIRRLLERRDAYKLAHQELNIQRRTLFDKPIQEKRKEVDLKRSREGEPEPTGSPQPDAEKKSKI